MGASLNNRRLSVKDVMMKNLPKFLILLLVVPFIASCTPDPNANDVNRIKPLPTGGADAASFARSTY